MPSVTPDSAQLIIESIGSAPTQIPEAVMKLARQLCAIHGPVRVAAESSGLHLYLASPACLEEDGLIELTKKHLAVNVDKWFRGEEWCALCMKTETPYSVNDLVSMQSLEARGYQDVQREVTVQAKDNAAFLEDDGRGHMVAKSPGRVVPVHTLPSTHPAQVYLRSRNFLAKDLFIQYRLAWCEAEREDVYYSRTEGGFRNTPQGRLVFYIEVNGVNVGWQARIPELEVDEHDGSQTKYYWHPYQQEWVAVSRRSDRATPWKYATPLPGYEGLEVRKYIIGAGARRNSCLMGFDEAMRWNNKFRRIGEPRVAVLTEGPLDAGRVGPPGIAMLGKFLSKDQAALLASRFDQVIYVAQNDESGQQAKGRVVEAMMAHPGVDLQLLNVPEMFKDMGEMSRPAARALVQQVCHLWMTATGYI